jgi:hypothetical protein
MKSCYPAKIMMLGCLLLGPVAAGPDYDVVVYGGTPGGIAASVMAARGGARVLLIEPTRHVGGMSTSGLTTAETAHMLPWTLGGFADEFYRRLGAHYGLRENRPAYEFESGVAEHVYLSMLREADLEVRYGCAIKAAGMEGRRIRGLTLTDGTTVGSAVFIDASYEGDLMARAGVSYTVGRERRDEFGEDLAGIRFDTDVRESPTVDADGRLLPGISGWKKDFSEGDAHPGVMNYNFRLIVTRDPAVRIPFPKPEHYDPARYQLLANWLKSLEGTDVMARYGRFIDLYPRRNAKLELNNRQAAIISLGHFGGQFDWPEADEGGRRRIYNDHLEYTLGLLHFLSSEDVVPENIRNDMRQLGLHSGEFADNGHLPYQLYVREGRRMRGAAMMRQQDVQTERRKPDSIGMGSHFLDCHHVQRLAVSPTGFINEGRIWRRGSAYQIPYGSITPKASECTNLLVPVAAGFTHVAFTSLRVEGTWMVTGHAAGVAAAIAATRKIPVQEVPVKTLQESLAAQGQVIDFMPGKPETCCGINGPEEF